LDRVSAVNATDPSIALIDHMFLISSNARQALDFSTAYSLASWPHSAEWGQKIFARSSRELLFPLSVS